MIEAVTLSNLIAFASLVSEIWLATDRQADRHKYRYIHYTDTQIHTLYRHTDTHIALASLVSEIWLATDRQTDRHTDTRIHRQTSWLHFNLFKVRTIKDFENKKTYLLALRTPKSMLCSLHCVLTYTVV